MSFTSDDLARFTHINSIAVPSLLRRFALMLVTLIAVTLIVLFLVPWVQTAYGTGTVTALNPEDRPQPINALVSGRIQKWFVEEGSRVKSGDPLLQIIDNDANFIMRLEEKRNAVQNELNAARINADTAEIDAKRQKELYELGLTAKRTYEQAKIRLNQSLAEVSKVEAALNRAQVNLAQQDMQTVRAPRDGTIVNIIAGNQATAIRSGEAIAQFIPANVVPAVEIFVDGNDIPLIQPGRKVRLQFEGWPVVQFSGWPSRAVGTFGGIVQSVDPTVSMNRRFRVIVVADPDDEPWPSERFLLLGAKVKGWVLLDTVSVGFELWRNLNNFPPEFPRDVTAEHIPTS